MGGRVADVIRLAAPLRTLLPAALGAAVALRPPAGPGSPPWGVPAAPLSESVAGATSGLLRPAAFVVLLALTASAARAVSTAGAGDRRGLRPALRLLLVGLPAAAALVVAALGARWGAFAAAALFLAVEWLVYLPPWTLGRTLPSELAWLAGEGVALPVAGYGIVVSVASGWAAAWPLIPFSALCAVALAAAAGLREDVRAGGGGPSFASLASPWVVAPAALTALAAALALVVAGGGPRLRPELALLGGALAVLPLVFGWFSLADPRPEWRWWRVEVLVRASGLALYSGLLVVVLLA